MAGTEAECQRDCLIWLNKNGWHAWRVNTTGLYDPITERYRKPGPFCLNGMSDAVAVKNGVVLFVEFKAVNGRQNEDQKLFEAALTRHGGHYKVVKSVGELEAWIKSMSAKSGSVESLTV